MTAALGYVYRDEVDKAVKDGLKEGLQKYGNDSVYTNEVDFMQSHVSLQSRKIGTVFISVGETGKFESAMSFFRCWHLIHFFIYLFYLSFL